MMRRIALLCVAVGACGPSVDDAGQSGSGDGGADAESVGGSGEGTPADGNPYDDCIASVTLRTDEIECWGALGVDVPGTCEACACVDTKCDRDSDCPSLPGSPSAECDGGGCVIPCEDDRDCPDSMRCGEHRGNGSQVCAEPLDDALACSAYASSGDWLDPCPALADRDSCEAMTSDFGYACKWATQRLYQVPTDDCAPIEATESCIRTSSDVRGPDVIPGVCDPSATCGPSETRAFIEDIGAGTLRLITYDDCEQYFTPLIDTQGNPVEPCDFTGPWPLPSICECACG